MRKYVLEKTRNMIWHGGDRDLVNLQDQTVSRENFAAEIDWSSRCSHFLPSIFGNSCFVLPIMEEKADLRILPGLAHDAGQAPPETVGDHRGGHLIWFGSWAGFELEDFHRVSPTSGAVH